MLTGLLRRELELDQDIYVPHYGGGGGTKDFFYKENRSFYLKFDKQIAHKISNKKNFLAILPVYQNELKSYLRSEKINVRNLSDLRMAVAYYNSLFPE